MILSRTARMHGASAFRCPYADRDMMFLTTPLLEEHIDEHDEPLPAMERSPLWYGLSPHTLAQMVFQSPAYGSVPSATLVSRPPSQDPMSGEASRPRSMPVRALQTL